MIKYKLRNGVYRDQNGRKHLSPSDLGGCLRGIQLRHQNAPTEDANYYMVKGKLVHLVVEDLIKSTNPAATKSWVKIRSKQAYLKWSWRLPLNMTMPKFEQTFKDFLLNTSIGKSLKKASPVWIEDKMAINLEDLNLPLQFPKEVLEKYVVVGLPDCCFSNLLLEFKTGSLQKKHFLQGLLYEKMAQIHYKNPKIRNRLVKIGPKQVQMGMMSKFWTKQGKFRLQKEQELLDELTKTVTHLELWEKDPNYEMPRSVSGSCYRCQYYPTCFSPITRMFRSINYKIGRNTRRVKMMLGMSRSLKKEKSIKIPASNIPKKI